MYYLNISYPCHIRLITTTTTASARRTHRRRLLLKNSPLNPIPTPTIFTFSDDALQITLKPPTDSIQQLLETKLTNFRDAFYDLRTLVSVDGQTGRVVVSCKRSTIELFNYSVLCGLVVFIVVVGFKRLFKFRKSEGEVMVYKRDRSLGGKVVAVGKREISSGKVTTPLSLSDGVSLRERRRRRRRERERELPSWWPNAVNWSGSGETDVVNKDDYQRLADQLIGAIMDRKMNGQDVSANDIVQLRHVCKTYGVRAITNTEHARDSLYRVAINFVLSYCESISNPSTSIQINGEDVREFVAGLADNIGLVSGRAARMVSAAVAAHTRSKILQAWALEVQNENSEALAELFKVCLLHRIFPPEESSPEMEMVARGLQKSLNAEQRASILDSFITVCGKDVERSLVEALGLEQIHTADFVAQEE